MPKLITKAQENCMNLEYQDGLVGNKLRVSFDLDMDSLVSHLTRRSNLTKKQVLDELASNEELKTQYIKACVYFGKDFIENQLHEVDAIVDFAEQTEARLDKVKKPKIK